LFPAYHAFNLDFRVSTSSLLRFRLTERRQWVGLFLGPLLFLITGLTLQAKGLSAQASWAGATVALMSCWWITEPMPLWVTACVPILTFPLLSGASFFVTLLQYLDPVNFLFLGGMLIAASMEQWGLHRRIALNIVSKIGTSPRRIVLGFMLATAFVTLWISNTAAAVMMFPIAMAVLRKFEEQHGRNDELLKKFGLALMLGIAYAASIGGIGTKIGTGTNLVFVKNSPQPIDFVTWAKMGMPVVLISIPLVWFYLVHFGARVPNRNFPGGAETIRNECAQLGRWKRGEVIALIAFLTAAILWIFRKDIDLGGFVILGWSRLIPWDAKEFLAGTGWPEPVQKIFSDPGDAVVSIIVAGGLLLIPAGRTPQNKRIFALSPRNAAGVAWSMLILLGGGFAMAYGIQASGLSTAIATNLKFIGDLNPFIAILAVSLVAVALTEVASNTATASILLPILAASAGSFGLSPLPLMLAVTMAASFGFMLPAGTPPNAIVFSSGYITVPQMVRSGLVVDIFGAVLVASICHFLVPWILGALPK
jgi:solute carrier family 13 (sodium-dependent dicarboxylate transporter), member 2/3/5